MFAAPWIEDVIRHAARRDKNGEPRCRLLLQLLAASDAVRGRLRQMLAEHGCSELGFEVLSTLQSAGGGPLPPSVIADRTGIFRGTLTDVLARLEAAGLISRRRNVDDRRQLLAELTGRGRERCEKILQHYAGTILEIVADLPPGALSKLGETLGELSCRAASIPRLTTVSHES